ncbi:COX17-domain-containing protein [Pisolithus orientalis]|uniref:COX17-domain-containing protein n=1 Tax=Pisolithus orientalis TaxID=936130 RepID=UPI002224940D|nr:COX17-domain-containing protein [Pisolithus orientalis]KAI6009507.1 COX17-domain-containing protein [Pisolithus orientalis]
MFSSFFSWWSPSPPAPAPEKYDPTNPKMNPLNPKGLKPCCACPETKAARDACFLEKGGDQGQCAEVLKKHVECMRSLGFEI